MIIYILVEATGSVSYFFRLAFNHGGNKNASWLQRYLNKVALLNPVRNRNRLEINGYSNQTKPHISQTYLAGKEFI